MTASDADSWARLRLVQGESNARVWELVSCLGHTTLTVGAAPTCNWVVSEEGVAPVHFSLHWDGSTLRIADLYGAGSVRLDGALVTAQWRRLSGRVRIDFGKAALVVETSGHGASDSAHPLDPTPIPPMADAVHRAATEPSQSGVTGRPNPKHTLLGVAPLVAGQPPMAQQAPVTPAPAGYAPSQPQSTPAGTDSFRPKRPSDTARPHKPTLMGVLPNVGSSHPPASASTGSSPSSPPAAVTSSIPPNAVRVPSSSAPAQGGIPAGTLMGMAGLGQRVSGASLGEADQRTIQGFPSSQAPRPPVQTPSNGIAGRRPTTPGMVSEAPGVDRSAVAQAPVRTVSNPPPAQRVGSTWQEVPEVAPADARGMAAAAQPAHPGVPHAVLVGDAVPQAASQGHHQYQQRPAPAPTMGAEPRGERFSEAPTQMRDMATLESKRPRRSFPWGYVGIAALTAVAYVAWLYLLDHM